MDIENQVREIEIYETVLKMFNFNTFLYCKLILPPMQIIIKQYKKNIQSAIGCQLPLVKKLMFQ